MAQLNFVTQHTKKTIGSVESANIPSDRTQIRFIGNSKDVYEATVMTSIADYTKEPYEVEVRVSVITMNGIENLI